MTADRPTPRVILPPGWQLIAVDDDNAATARHTFRDAWNQGPHDSIGPFIHRMEDWLTQILDEARAGGGVAVILPMGIPWQVPVSTAIVLSRVVPPDHAPQLPTTGELIDTDAGPARRRFIDQEAPVVVDADLEIGAITLLRTIEYTWVTPGSDAYLIAFASISGLPVVEYRPVADALTLLIDTILGALQWPATTAPVTTTREHHDAAR